MHFSWKGAMILFMASSVSSRVRAGDTNPPIDNQSITVDFSTVTLLPSDQSGYSGLIQADDAHKIYLKCTDTTGTTQSVTTVVPCSLQDGHLVTEQATWSPYHSLETYLFFEPKATFVSGVISGSIGSSTLSEYNILQVRADGAVLFQKNDPPSNFEYSFSSGPSSNISMMKLTAGFTETLGAALGDVNAYYKVHLNSITWTTQPQYKLNVRTMRNGDSIEGDDVDIIDHPTPTKVKSGDSLTFPLGARAKITLKEAGSGVDVPATYSLIGSPTFNPSIPEEEQSKGLYMDRLGILLGSGVMTDQDSVWVHMGSQALVITPDDTKKPPITIYINVNAPSSLGSKNLKYDDLIVKYAHWRGIPPQFIKGEVDQESSFIESSFRYEPTTIDKKKISGSRDKYDAPYRKYLFGPVSNSILSSSVIHPRNKYGVSYKGEIVAIPDQYEITAANGRYTPLLCSQIMAINNNGATGFTAWNWDKTVVEGLVRYKPIAELDYGNLLYNYLNQQQLPQIINAYSQYNFIAQTTVASSYGLMQVLYITAASPFDGEYIDSDGLGLNPSDLLTADTNLRIGSLVLRKKYKAVNGNISTYARFSDFVKSWRKGFQKYNGAAGPPDSDDGAVYNFGVWSKSKLYFPLGRSSIFN